MDVAPSILLNFSAAINRRLDANVWPPQNRWSRLRGEFLCYTPRFDSQTLNFDNFYCDFNVKTIRVRLCCKLSRTTTNNTVVYEIAFLSVSRESNALWKGWFLVGIFVFFLGYSNFPLLKDCARFKQGRIQVCDTGFQTKFLTFHLQNNYFNWRVWIKSL